VFTQSLDISEIESESVETWIFPKCF